MRALETEQHAAAPTNANGAKDPRRVHSAPQPSTRRGAHGRWLRGAPSWMIACIVSAGLVTALVVQLTSGTGTTAPRRPGHALATDTADREPQRRDGQIPRGGTRRRSQPRSGTIAERPRREPVAPPTNIPPHPSTPWIPLVEHDHIIGQRHIRSGRYRSTVRPLELQPGLGLRVVRIGARISRDAAAHLAQLEPGLKLLHPIESHPPLTRHRSRHLQLPVGRTRRTPTGR